MIGFAANWCSAAKGRARQNGVPKHHLRGFRLRETPTVEKSPQDTGPYFWPVKPSKENSHVYIQRKTR